MSVPLRACIRICPSAQEPMARMPSHFTSTHDGVLSRLAMLGAVFSASIGARGPRCREVDGSTGFTGFTRLTGVTAAASKDGG